VVSSKVEETLGELLGRARASLGLSLQDVARGAGCSTAYVHKLEHDRIRSPSPRVLAGLVHVLGVDYDLVMQRAGYRGPSQAEATAPATSRFSNAHIVELLEQLLEAVAEIRRELSSTRSSP
jgi:transcriptional regulator with XRE-family HTH domain